MAQTTNALSFVDVDINMSNDNFSSSDFTAEGFANSISISGGERAVGETPTFDGDVFIIKKGKRSPLDITVRFVYTETDAHLWDTYIRPAYEEGSDLYIRFWPEGDATGNYQFTTSVGIVTSQIYPQGVAETGDPINVEFTLKVASLTKAAVA